MEDMNREQDVLQDNKKQETPKKEKKTGWKYELFDLARTFVICFILVWLISHFLVRPVRVDGESMKPTLMDEELGLMNIISLKTGGIDRYDVVVVNNKQANEDWVKRVIGLPGDRLYAKDDVVYVNGKAIEEPYLDTDYANAIRARGEIFTKDFEEVILDEDEYFLMGDNRLLSHDSRAVGPFKGEDIIGKDVYVFYPFNEMKIVGNGNS